VADLIAFFLWPMLLFVVGFVCGYAERDWRERLQRALRDLHGPH
jgi:hypothetical protein